MDKYTEANRALWDEMTHINAGSELYQLAQFKAGENKLNPLERGEAWDRWKGRRCCTCSAISGWIRFRGPGWERR